MLPGTIGCLILAVSSFAMGQTSAPHRVPGLLSAEMPRYTPIARASSTTGWVEVRVGIVDGNVVNEKVVRSLVRDGQGHICADCSLLLITPTLENLRTWRFDSKVSQSLDVTFTYEMKGSETEQPENPDVEILPSLDVHIIARPVKPVVMP
jgi:hypothetical protein